MSRRRREGREGEEGGREKEALLRGSKYGEYIGCASCGVCVVRSSGECGGDEYVVIGCGGCGCGVWRDHE